ncbi:MAG: tetratricopeptide repeat protein [Thermomicrobiales bacterium]|nr:tetratricopeptide repeat protein [Thermomicrobiales bacterium]
MSQEGLAERAGLSVRGISDLERGARTFPRLETVRLLADALQLSDDDRALFLVAARPELETGAPAVAPRTRPDRRLTVPSLPIPPTRLIGRDDEISRIVERFRSGETRLVTLTGQGGIEKSRLGLAIARGFSRELNGRVAFLELAPIRDPALVAATIAAGLEVPIDTAETIPQAIGRAIGNEPMLLVIDNWEHVLDAATLVSILLAQCEGLWILATSRERLRLRGEWEVRLEPLPLPENGVLDVAELTQIPAVELFVRRANEATDGFALTEQNAPIVGEICRRLDGLPLAIELAAARTRLLTPEALLDRLEGRLRVLTEGPRDLPERLQTMYSAIAWSVDLLEPGERRLFAQLSVFEGGFTIPAARGVLAQGPAAFPPEAVEDGIVSLVEKSLVRTLDIGGAEPRFLFYETIREFAREHLGQTGDAAALADAHARYVLALAEESEAGLMGPDPMPTFERLDADIGNLRAALQYLRDRGDTQSALRIASALAWFWTEPRYLVEGQRWLGTLLAESAACELPRELRVRALVAAGDLAIWQGALDDAAVLHSEALDLLRDSGNDGQMATVLRSLANVALERHEFARADELLMESRAMARTAGNDWEVAASANLLGLSRTMQGSPDWAIERHQEAVEIWRELGDKGHVFDALAGLGWAELLADRIAESAQTYRDALDLTIETGDVLQIEWCLRAAAAVAASRGAGLERATRLFSASEAIREETEIDLRIGIGEIIDRLTESVRAELGPMRFARGWQAGQRLTRDQAIAEARLVFELAASSQQPAVSESTTNC